MFLITRAGEGRCQAVRQETPSCLILGFTDDNKRIHIVCSLEEDNIWMITAYYPASSEWLD
ncbi:DUF4258 domain-containing protein, partial [Soehngenia saccharolytica]